MSMDLGGGGGGPRSEINVTPLVDVVLVLLIIFMVVQPLLQMGYDVQVPPNALPETPVTPPTEQLVVSMTANKTPGVRAALCGDAETARGARAWNDANVLCMSMRTTTPIIAREIIEAWLAGEVDPAERNQIERIERGRA